MVEVAVFADILTLKEALEFDRHVNRDTDFLLTELLLSGLGVHDPQYLRGTGTAYAGGGVSDDRCGQGGEKDASGCCHRVYRSVPCQEKRRQKEPDICDAIDVVLTFQETAMLFEAMGIAPQQMEDASEHSSGAGRIYARTGGVSEAVVRTVEQLHPGRKIAVRPMQADGGKACKQMIEAIQAGKTEANFF